MLSWINIYSEHLDGAYEFVIEVEDVLVKSDDRTIKFTTIDVIRQKLIYDFSKGLGFKIQTIRISLPLQY